MQGGEDLLKTFRLFDRALREELKNASAYSEKGRSRLMRSHGALTRLKMKLMREKKNVRTETDRDVAAPGRWDVVTYMKLRPMFPRSRKK